MSVHLASIIPFIAYEVWLAHLASCKGVGKVLGKVPYFFYLLFWLVQSKMSVSTGKAILHVETGKIRWQSNAIGVGPKNIPCSEQADERQVNCRWTADIQCFVCGLLLDDCTPWLPPPSFSPPNHDSGMFSWSVVDDDRPRWGQVTCQAFAKTTHLQE